MKKLRDFFKCGKKKTEDPGKRKQEEFEMRDVYAGPEQMNRPAFGKTNRRAMEFKAVYAGPEMFDRIKKQEEDQETPDPFKMPPYPENYAVTEEQETVVCPTCGEKTRNGKFCEYCGNRLNG